MDNEIFVEATKEIAKDIYDDGGKPVVKPTGELLGLIPRAIKAALNPLEKWILKKEYNLEETKKLLEKKLENVPPELIEEPEPYIAVPAIQNISYCMDNEELRDMYANLLANSMNKVVKEGVHPGFVEIIKQMSPDEAKIMKYFSLHNTIPVIDLKAEDNSGAGIEIINSFSNIGELSKCENPLETGKIFDNLIRLGLLLKGHLSSLTKKELYIPLKEHPYIIQNVERIKSRPEPYCVPGINESYIKVTDFGKSFCNICISSRKIIMAKID